MTGKDRPSGAPRGSACAIWSGAEGSAWAGREFIPGSQSFDADLGREEEKQL